MKLNRSKILSPVPTSPSPDPVFRYRAVRRRTEELCAPLELEDCVIQSMPDVSPPKWHLAHTTWFFENFILLRYVPGYKAFHPRFGFLFNSYYETVGEHHPRAQRGLLSRPTMSEIRTYRSSVDAHMDDLLRSCPEPILPEVQRLTCLGLNHEEQHQELILTDLKHILFSNPLRPAYLPKKSEVSTSSSRVHWVDFSEGIFEIGNAGGGFSFDNERPRHRVFLEAFRLSSRLVTNGEYLEFIRDGGYREPRHWLSDGWDSVTKNSWQAPLYWENQSGNWQSYTLGGNLPIDPSEPVCHVSYYEADAFARWAKRRLPNEAEWEIAAGKIQVEGNFLESGSLQPVAAGAASAAGLQQMFGDVWEWTQSPYVAYPGFVPEAGNLGEYNGKFMCNQWVLRGGSCLTPASHVRLTYRNFFPPAARWQMTGFRLAE